MLMIVSQPTYYSAATVCLCFTSTEGKLQYLRQAYSPCANGLNGNTQSINDFKLHMRNRIGTHVSTPGIRMSK